MARPRVPEGRAACDRVGSPAPTHLLRSLRPEYCSPGSGTTSSRSLSEECAGFQVVCVGGARPTRTGSLHPGPALTQQSGTRAGWGSEHTRVDASKPGGGSGWVRADGGGVGRARERSICTGTACADAGKECRRRGPTPRSAVWRARKRRAVRLRSGLCLRHMGTPGGRKSRGQRTDLCGLGGQAAGSRRQDERQGTGAVPDRSGGTCRAQLTALPPAATELPRCPG